MEKISMLQFRRHAEQIIRRAQRGERMLLTYRGKPVLRLEPIADEALDDGDPFYSIDRLAVSGGESLTNEQIDESVYGK